MGKMNFYMKAIVFPQIIFVFLIFQIKRFKSGWKFLEQYGKSDIGFIISITVLLSYSLFSESAESSSKMSPE